MEATTKEINAVLADGRNMLSRPWRRLATDAGASWKWPRSDIGITRVVVFDCNWDNTDTSRGTTAIADARRCMDAKGYTNHMWVTPSGYLKVQCDMG